MASSKRPKPLPVPVPRPRPSRPGPPRPKARVPVATPVPEPLEEISVDIDLASRVPPARRKPDFGPPPFPDGEETGPGANTTLVEAQAILGAFDAASHVVRLEMVELVRAFAELSGNDRQMVIAIAARLSR